MSTVLEGKVVFWDFDGVIKESVDVKTRGFVTLFESYGAAVTARVRQHHEDNGGMPRSSKLPLYLRWAGEDPTEARVQAMAERFGELVRQAVVDAPWVPGADAYLRRNARAQTFVLVSATPDEELRQIVRAVDLEQCFVAIFGAPTTKQEAIGVTLRRLGMDAADCLMIGDARQDLDAARANHVPFLLRRHGSNDLAFRDYRGPSIVDFTHV